MYGTDKTNLAWGASPSRRRSTAEEPDAPTNSTQRFTSGVNYYGLEGSESSSGGFTQVPRAGGGGGGGGHSRSANTGDTPAEKSQREKVNQIVQAFFWKAAMVIVQSRIPTVPIVAMKTGEKKTNKWFNIELDEMETFREEIRPWRIGDSFDPRPPPLIIETYLDTADLTPTQALVVLDSNEKRWNVTEALENAANRAGLNAGIRRGERGPAKAQQIVLERWKIELTHPFDIPQGQELPVVYKKGIILFRALYSYLSLMPTWKFRRRLAKLKLQSSALKIGCRVQSGDDFARLARRWDGLQIPLYPGDERVTDEFSFGKVESPAGCFNITVSFRKNCDFRVDDSESLLSSHFINLDEHYFRPSSHQRTTSQPYNLAAARGVEQGSIPTTVSTLPQRPEYVPANGSLSSYHQAMSPHGASPISALRGTPMDRVASGSSPADRPSTGLRSIQGSRASLRGTDIPSVSRRGSISFQPFKSPSLSASPATSEPTYQPSSLGRISTPGGAYVHRTRPSIGAISPSSYKSAQSTPATAPGETSSSQAPIPIINNSPMPQPMTRIASSFGSRRPRISSAASVTRADDDNSSGQASYTSSMAAPGSGLYTAAGTSSYEEDLQIRDFMSMLADGQKTSLKSFGAPAAESSRIAPLSKFQKMKDSHSALADSLSSSLLLPTPGSPSTSSRNLSSVPGMVPSTTFSSSSSPGKPLSPHTPHTPAVPSRLSENLTAQYEQHRRPGRPSPVVGNDNESSHRREASGGGNGSAATTSPLDIPVSPRFMGPRRANSMSQQHHEPAAGNHTIDFGPIVPYENVRQSVSLSSVDNAPLSNSRLQDLHNASESALPGREEAEAASRRHDDEEDDTLAFGPAIPPPSMDSVGEEAPRFQYQFHRGNGLSSSGSSYRGSSRPSMRGRGNTPPMGSTTGLDRNMSSATRPGMPGGRTSSCSRGQDEDELLFAMSDEIFAQQQHSRRSLEGDKPDSPASAGSGRRRSRGGNGRGGW
ncbi:autophagy-related protein 13-domain-containing protein [Tricharina praecox]|uniref:autophagy-related protein 13-domain-containing protein n=1 Tax=Tricharina praecox TaxID=43433 RepID=UPI0022207481|nr:autophagy-related protein 13-domain-containing protein [Tricharina praecox]KAI5849748.1 autophagy-related protein 13-domain-containing protein [Tricharina praecox]